MSARSIVLGLAVVLTLTGCGGGSDEGGPDERGGESPAASSSAPTSAPTEISTESLTERCNGVGEAETTAYSVESPSGATLYAAEAGRGPRAVVLVHGSGTIGACAWAADVPWLSEDYRTIAYDAVCVGNSTCPAGELDLVDDLVAVVDAARERGARDVVVVAASAGGPLAIQVAARPDAGIRASVALSPAGLGTTVDGGEGSNAEAAQAAQVPVLYVLAENDPAATPAEVRSLAAASRAAGSQVRIPAGADHAQDLLTADDGGPTRERAALLAFVAEAFSSAPAGR